MKSIGMRNRELFKTARTGYLQTPNPLLDSQRSPNANVDGQRLSQFQNLLISPISRRSNPTRNVVLNTSDSSSEEETDDNERDDPSFNNSNGVAIFEHDKIL